MYSCFNYVECHVIDQLNFYCWYIILRVSLSNLSLIDFVHCNCIVCYRVHPWPHPSGSDVPDFPETNYDVVRHAFLKVI